MLKIEKSIPNNAHITVNIRFTAASFVIDNANPLFRFIIFTNSQNSKADGLIIHQTRKIKGKKI